MKNITSLLRLCLFAFAAFALSTQAAEKTLKFRNGSDGYAGAIEAGIEQGKDLIPDSYLNIWVGVRGEKDGKNTLCQSLVRFDEIFGKAAGQIPAGATITKATLTLSTGSKKSALSKSKVLVSRILVPWDKNAAWKYKSWGNDGLQTDDREAAATPDATVVFDRNSAAYDIDITKSLRAWAGGAANHGWLFTLPADRPDLAGFVTSRSPKPSQRPVLTVTFTAP